MKADFENYGLRLPLSSGLTRGLTLSPQAGRGDERGAAFSERSDEEEDGAALSLLPAKTGRRWPVHPPQLLRSCCGGLAGWMRGTFFERNQGDG